LHNFNNPRYQPQIQILTQTLTPHHNLNLLPQIIKQHLPLLTSIHPNHTFHFQKTTHSNNSSKILPPNPLINPPSIFIKSLSNTL
ncbi:phospho-sugar glycosidase domain-containing protein, partial [Staphylococcus aureus]|uniref:phospho-sugar glycosidase domain-containing protein n=1 Tax=Staphylococcus aureus TaxID=1280 RepID=UPI0011A59B85